jgi:sulfite reductase (NADPH) hemoprotein beta-component
VAADPQLAGFAERNVHAHRAPGYASVTVSLKPIGKAPGDATAEQMEVVARLAETYGHDEIRVSHEQNLVLPHVRKRDIPAIFAELRAHDLGEANAGLVTDIIACPGMDFCALATARSIPVAERISERFAAAGRQREIGDLKIKISGCINACGHHHVGHIGILGVEKKGEEFYQITLGGSADEKTSIGEIVGRGFSYDEVVDAVEKIVDTYIDLRSDHDEDFLAAYRRVGDAPFKEALYGTA